MSFKGVKIGLILAAAIGMGGIAPISAEEQTTSSRRASQAPVAQDGYRTATRLGGSRALMGPIRNRAALKRMAANKTQQKRISGVMDKAGLTALTPQVLQAMTAADTNVVKETKFDIGRTMDWMGLRQRGRPDILRNIRWGGRRPFDAYEFTVEDGYKNYNFVIPKVCGNLALANVTEDALPECVTLNVERDCDTATKTMTIRASGGSIGNNEVTRVEVSRGGQKFTDLMPGQGFRYSGPIQPGRYSVKAFDKYDREVPICSNQREFVVEDCPAPAAPPPPPSPVCTITAAAAKAPGGWAVTLDGSASAQGPGRAKEMTVEIVDPTGKVVPFEYQGKSMTSLTMAPPFQASVLLRRPVAGTYTVRGKCVPEDPKVQPSNCEASFAIVQEDKISYFVGGYVGKERRQREVELDNGVIVTPGFCAPLVGFKGGVGFRVAPNWQIAPALGFAINTDEGDDSSLFGDVEFNYLFDQGGYVGTGIGIWDFTHSDTVTGSWLLHFGVPVHTTANGNRLFIAGEWRFLFDGIDEVDSNYQFWGGLRYEWKRR